MLLREGIKWQRVLPPGIDAALPPSVIGRGPQHHEPILGSPLPERRLRRSVWSCKEAPVRCGRQVSLVWLVGHLALREWFVGNRYR